MTQSVPVADWLQEKTPAGAPTLTGWAVNTVVPISVVPLPLTLPSDCYERPHPWRALATLGLREDGHMRISEMLEGPGRGSHGLPAWFCIEAADGHARRHVSWAYDRGTPTAQDDERTAADLASSRLEQRTSNGGTVEVTIAVQRNTSPPLRRGRGTLRAIIATVTADLFGGDRFGLDLAIGLQHVPGGYRAALGGDLAADRQTDRAVHTGRRVLHALGVWPWVHADLGQLPADWLTLPTFIEPLERWHAAAIRDADEQLDRQRRF